MNTFGLDIGSNTIKICQTAASGGKVRLLSAGLSPSSSAGLRSESEADLISLSEIIKKLHRDLKVTTNKAVIGLPESQVFSKIIELPKMTEEEMVSAVPWEAEQNIPLPLSEVTLDWQIIGQSVDQSGIEKTKIFMVAAPNSLIEKYSKVIEHAEMQIAAIETDLLASSRILVPPAAGPTMIIDIGAVSTDIGIVNKGQLIFTRSIPTAGDALTRTVSSSLVMEIMQAEQYKISYGLGANQLEGKIFNVLKPVFDIIANEAKKALIFWRENEKDPVKNVILYGGSANLPQATTLLAASLETEVQIADPFKNIEMDNQLRSVLLDKSSLLTVAIGLSQKEV